MKPRIKAGAPQSIAAAGAAEKIKDSIESNSIGQGENGTTSTSTPAGAPTRAERRRKANEKPKPKDIPKQGRLGRKGQEDLPGMPKPDAVGRAARAYVQANDDLETAKDAVVSTARAAIVALKKAGRREITVDGCTIKYIHKEAVDRLTIKRPKNK